MRNLSLCMFLPALLLLGGCQTIGNAADSLGEHMPVIGERCEHWQCITDSGEAQSEANKRLAAQAQAKAQQQQAGQQNAGQSQGSEQMPPGTAPALPQPQQGYYYIGEDGNYHWYQPPPGTPMAPQPPLAGAAPQN